MAGLVAGVLNAEREFEAAESAGDCRRDREPAPLPFVRASGMAEAGGAAAAGVVVPPGGAAAAPGAVTNSLRHFLTRFLARLARNWFLVFLRRPLMCFPNRVA